MKEHISLKPYNTFSIDVTARYFIPVNSVGHLQRILADSRWKTIPRFVLGGGSNILFTRNVDGLVLHNQIHGIDIIANNADFIDIKVGAGENWHDFVMYCVLRNYAGIENLSLIPGTVGAAPIQNIGAYGVELKDVLREVHTIEIEKNTPRIFSNLECEFGYRDSIFKNSFKNRYIVTHIVLRFQKMPVFHVEYGTLREKLNGAPLSIRAISDAIIQIRREKLPDPAAIPNAGSFFKNPMVSQETFLQLQKTFPVIPHFPEPNHHVKIPAAWLIEQCGFKGKHFGHAGVHAHQPLVIVNNGDATGAEIKALSEQIQVSVLEKFQIALSTEVNIC